jgi:hypothetical protein
VTVGRRRVDATHCRILLFLPHALRLTAVSAGALSIFFTISLCGYSSLAAARCHEGRSQIRPVPMSKQLCVTPGMVNLTPKCTEQSFEAAWCLQGSEWFRSLTSGSSKEPSSFPGHVWILRCARDCPIVGRVIGNFVIRVIGAPWKS